MKTENSLEERLKPYRVLKIPKTTAEDFAHIINIEEKELLGLILQELSTSRLELIKELREKIAAKKSSYKGPYDTLEEKNAYQDGRESTLQEVNDKLNSITNEE